MPRAARTPSPTGLYHVTSRAIKPLRLFQDAHAAALATESHACAAVVYVAVNPVQAGICARPELWPFGNHRAHACLEPCPPWLEPVDELGLFRTADSYRRAVDHAMAQISTPGSGRKARPQESDALAPGQITVAVTV